MVLSFKSKHEIKEKYLASTYDWLNMKNIPKSAEEITKELFNPIRTYIPSDCVLENYEEFPSKLGLPDWLGNLLFTINHHNSIDFSGFGENYEEYFYPAFLKSCHVGVDYSLMFHKWELMILTDMIPKQERDEKYFHDLIKLHKNALDGKELESNKWNELQAEIDNHLQEIEARTITWNSGRTAFLSIENHINKQDPYTTSSEAIVDALIAEYINKNTEHDNKSKEEFRKNIWFELMQKLVIMLNEWK
jgi:hypothetical protein